MNTIYLFREKKTDKVIYVGSSSRVCKRLGNHISQLRGEKAMQPIHHYMVDNNLILYKDVEVVLVDFAPDRESMLELESEYFFKYQSTVLNIRPAEIRKREYHHLAKPVLCENTGEIFGSISCCAEHFGINRKSVQKVVWGNKPHHTINGVDYSFKFVE